MKSKAEVVEEFRVVPVHQDDQVLNEAQVRPRAGGVEDCLAMGVSTLKKLSGAVRGLDRLCTKVTESSQAVPG